ncbi:MAG: NAD(P)-dependent oxidoreductase [Anaerolineae bacterium]|nr:NAD(P)-dependent oxidoreductase [Anaerolineae bacterium]
MTSLITGAGGFVGINLVRRLASQGQRVVAVARRAPDEASLSFLGDLNAQVTWANVDVRDREGLARLATKHHADVIIHAATITAPRPVEMADPASLVDVNLGGTLNALEAARLAGARRFVFISSTGVYGAPEDPTQPIRETRPLAISSIYTICKQAGEALCRRYAELFGLSAVSGRLGTAYGPMERATHSRSTMSVLYALTHAAWRGERVRVHGADRRRDFCYIDDVADAFAHLALAERLSWDVYNVAGDRACTVREALDSLQALVPGFAWDKAEADEAEVVTLPASVRGTLDMSRLREDTGFTPRYSLAEGLRAYLIWLKSHSEIPA